MPELMLIMVIALIVLGPEKLPDFALRVGRMVYQFRQQYMEIASQIRAEIERAQQEVQGLTGDLGLGFDGASSGNTPRLRVSILGAVAGIEPTPPTRLTVQSSALAAVCGRPLPAAPPVPAVEALAVGEAALASPHPNGSPHPVETPMAPAQTVGTPEQNVPLH